MFAIADGVRQSITEIGNALKFKGDEDLSTFVDGSIFTIEFGQGQCAAEPNLIFIDNGQDNLT